MKEFLNKSKNKISNLLKKETILKNKDKIIPILITSLIAIISIIKYIIFIANGEYAKQIYYIKEYGFSYGSKEYFFRKEKISFIPTDTIFKIVTILIIAQIIVILVKYFENKNKAMRIGMIIDLSAILVLLGFSINSFYKITKELIINGNSYKIPTKIFLIHLGLLLVSIIVFIILILVNKDCKKTSKYTLFNLLLASIIIPISLYIIEYFIPIIGKYLYLVIIAAIIFFYVIYIITQVNNDYIPSSNLYRNSSGNSYKGVSSYNSNNKEDGTIEKVDNRKYLLDNKMYQLEQAKKKLEKLNKDAESIENLAGWKLSKQGEREAKMQAAKIREQAMEQQKKIQKLENEINRL